MFSFFIFAFSIFCLRERYFYVSQIFTSQNQIFHKEKLLLSVHIFCRTHFFPTHFSYWSTMESCFSTMKSCQSTIESSPSTMESCYSTMKSSQSTIESSQNTREQQIKENGRILHNLTFV